MIIQVRGTSGSGKSTIMRRVMESGGLNPVYVTGRKRPLYYRGRINGAKVAVLGHYESACGGCDTIGSARVVYDLIQKIDSPVILCEGLLLSEDVKWSSQLPDLRVLYLSTPLKRCIRQIESRRKSAGNDKPLNPANTENRVYVIERSRVKLRDAGVLVRRCASEIAPAVILSWLRLHAEQGV